MAAEVINLEFGRWTKEIVLDREPGTDFDPEIVRQWDIAGPRFSNPDWHDLTDEQVANESEAVYGYFGYEKAPLRLVALMTGDSGLHRFSHPFDALTDPEITAGVRLIVDLALDDQYPEELDALTVARRGFTDERTYLDGNGRHWDCNVVFAHLMTAIAERGRPSAEGEHITKFNRGIYWPGSVASMFAIAHEMGSGNYTRRDHITIMKTRIQSGFKSLSLIGGEIEPRTVKSIRQKILELSNNEDLENWL